MIKVSSEYQKSNGAKQALLWINTVLTAILIPVLGFMAIRMWDKMDRLSDKLDLNAERLIRVEERQNRVLTELPKLNAADIGADERLKKLEQRKK